MKRLFPPLEYVNAPNLLSSAAVVVSATSLWLLANGYVRAPGILFLVAVAFDFLDGRVARRFNQSTPLGRELDSLADVLNFCATPALGAWMMGMRGLGEVLVLTFFVLAGAWRLAYYSIHGLEDADGNAMFTGVPTPVAASFIVDGACASRVLGVPFTTFGLPLFAVVALLMISGVRVPKKGWFPPFLSLVTAGFVTAVVVRG